MFAQLGSRREIEIWSRVSLAFFTDFLFKFLKSYGKCIKKTKDFAGAIYEDILSSHHTGCPRKIDTDKFALFYNRGSMKIIKSMVVN